MKENRIDTNVSPNRDEVLACKSEIATILRNTDMFSGRGYRNIQEAILMAAYTLIKATESESPYDYSLGIDKNIDKDIVTAIKSGQVELCWEKLKELAGRYSADVFYQVAVESEMSDAMSTPTGICRLAEELLGIKPGEKVVDLGCGKGTFAFNIKKDRPEADVYAVDVRKYDIAIAKIVNEISHNTISVENKDMFELASESPRDFDKVFSNYPMGVRIRDLQGGEEYIEALRARIPAMDRATSSDWVFNALMTDLISTEGKAVGIMTNGSTWNLLDAQIRKYFLENGLIECVIALPQRIFLSTNIPTSMIVMSHNNKGVRLVDATRTYVAGRRTNELCDDNICRILKAVENDGDISKYIDLETLRENDYVLSLSRYINNGEQIKDGRPFREVIRRITRGAPLNAARLDELASQNPTDMRYLRTANIQDGFIDEELPYLKEISKENERYCLTDRCLILAKNGFPYKIAVADLEKDQKILANANLYIIELDEELIDPYYLAAFLGSKQGMEALKRISVGASVLNIGADQLKDMIIPVPPLTEQKEISDRYKTARNEIKALRKKLKEAEETFENVYEGR